MLKYTQNEMEQESSRSITTDSEAVFFAFDGIKHTVGFAKSNPFKVRNPPSWSKHKIPNRINLIDKRYGKLYRVHSK